MLDFLGAAGPFWKALAAAALGGRGRAGRDAPSLVPFAVGASAARRRAANPSDGSELDEGGRWMGGAVAVGSSCGDGPLGKAPVVEGLNLLCLPNLASPSACN